MGQPGAFTVDCAGGLDVVSTTQQLFEKPGFATELINYESSPDGGYRRINGYEIIGESYAAAPSGYPVKGVAPYADGVVVVTEDGGVFFTQDGIVYTDLAWDTAGFDVAEDSLVYETPLGRTSHGRVQWVVYEGNTDYGELIICDGSNYALYIKATGSGGSRTWLVEPIDAIAAPNKPQWCEVHGERLILGGESTARDTIYYSNLYDVEDFIGGNSIQVAYTITGIKEWREKLFIFGKIAIQELSDINGTPAIVSISNNVGTLSGHSIQEVGGDLIYLSVDGLRTLKGTERIDDIELGSISNLIQPLLRPLINDYNNLDISSVVIRNKDQYRIFFTKEAYSGESNQGFIGTYKMGPQGLRWEWSEIRGVPLSCISSGVLPDVSNTISTDQEVLIHGGYDGFIYLHDSGNDFNGTKITASYMTPEIVYNDWGTRKTLHWIRYSMDVDGLNNGIRLSVKYNFDSNSISQPEVYTVGGADSIALYGTAVYGSDVYGGGSKVEGRVLINGGGFSNNFKWWSDNTQAPYSIKNFYVRYYGGKIL